MPLLSRYLHQIAALLPELVVHQENAKKEGADAVVVGLDAMVEVQERGTAPMHSCIARRYYATTELGSCCFPCIALAIHIYSLALVH